MPRRYYTSAQELAEAWRRRQILLRTLDPSAHGWSRSEVREATALFQELAPLDKERLSAVLDRPLLFDIRQPVSSAAVAFADMVLLWRHGQTHPPDYSRFAWASKKELVLKLTAILVGLVFLNWLCIGIVLEKGFYEPNTYLALGALIVWPPPFIYWAVVQYRGRPSAYHARVREGFAIESLLVRIDGVLLGREDPGADYVREWVTGARAGLIADT